MGTGPSAGHQAVRLSADADKLKMNSENSFKISAKKLSSVDDDFESLFEEEEINIDSQNKKEALDFNDLFEAISEEPEDSVEHISGESHAGNVEEDFEALLADETFTCTESESNTNEDKSTNESPNDQSLVTGFSQIFSSHSPLQSSDNPGNIRLPEPGNTLTQVIQLYQLLQLKSLVCSISSPCLGLFINMTSLTYTFFTYHVNMV